MENKEFISGYFNDMKKIIENISVKDIGKAVELLYDTWRQGSQIFVCGNGGSASTATHFTCDLSKTCIVADKPRFRAYCLNDNIPLTSALANDDGFDNVFYEQLIGRFQSGDLLISISVHGGAGRDRASLWSQNLLKAMNYAKEIGGQTLSLSGFDGGPMKEIADVCIVVPAESTPQVESFHAAIAHLLCICVREKMAVS